MQLETAPETATSEISERLVRVTLDYLVSGEIKIDLHFSDRITTNNVDKYIGDWKNYSITYNDTDHLIDSTVSVTGMSQEDVQNFFNLLTSLFWGIREILDNPTVDESSPTLD